MKTKNVFILGMLLFTTSLVSCSNQFDEGYNSGHGDGYSEGHEDGYGDGYDVGYGDGYDVGYGYGYADGSEAADSDDVEIDITDNEAVYDIHTDAQYAYLTGKSLEVTSNITGLEEKSKPVPVVITGVKDSRYQTKDVTSYVLKLSTSSDMSEYVEYTNNIDKFTLNNLNIATRYYYTITANTSGGAYTSAMKTFSVNGLAPRNIDIDGVTNVRDQGGWLIAGTENRTAQNLIYRTAKLHDDYLVNVTTEGKEEFKRLGIKTEIDLRDPDHSDLKTLSSPLEGVDYYNCGMTSDDYFTTPVNIEGIKEAFLVMSDVNNYPLLFHCAIGTDRTGFISFLINCLSGVSTEDMCRDYVFSSFASINGIRYSSAIRNYVDILNRNYSANNDNAQGATNFLKGIGLTTGQINVVKEMIVNGKLISTHHAATTWTPSTLNPDVYHEQVCTDSDCGVVVHKEKHEFSEMVIVEEPTLTKDGIGHHYCLVCGYEKEEVLPKTGKTFSYTGISSYGTSSTFTIKTSATLNSINGSLTNLKLTKNGTTIPNVTYTYEKQSTYSTIKFTLESPLNSGDVVTINKDTVISDGNESLVLDKDIHFTCDGTGFYPSWLLNPLPYARKGSGGILSVEFDADFTDFRGGEARESLQPYYTKKKGSNFTYTVTRNNTVIKTFVNDCVNDVHNGEIVTSMYWDSARILRIEFEKFFLQDGDILKIHKGATYADNGFHEGGAYDVRKYILHEDVVVRFNEADYCFEIVS